MLAELLLHPVLVLLVLTNLKVLGSSQPGSCIRATQWQGCLLALLPFLAHSADLTWRLAAAGLGTLALKGFVFPSLLFRALREADATREAETPAGYIWPLLAAMGAWGLAFWLGEQLPLAHAPSNLLVPAAFFAILSGLFLIAGQKSAASQVLGFLVLENGVFTFGIGAVQEPPVVVELGVLLDLFVAALVMGIARFHIHGESGRRETGPFPGLKD
jgi:hydrogenase-4 component E